MEKLISLLEQFVGDLRKLHAKELAKDHLIVCYKRDKPTTDIVWTPAGWAYASADAVKLTRDEADAAIGFIKAPNANEWRMPTIVSLADYRTSQLKEVERAG